MNKEMTLNNLRFVDNIDLIADIEDMLAQTWSSLITRSTCSPNIPYLYANFVKKLVSEIRKCRQLQGTSLKLKQGTS